MERFRLQSKLHERLNSFTTITLHAENMKILKRHRSINNLRLEDMKLTRSSTFSYSEDLQPPLAMFSRFGSSSSLSSTASSTASSGSDVSISNSPIEEMNEFWESGSLDGCVDEKRGDLDEKRAIWTGRWYKSQGLVLGAAVVVLGAHFGLFQWLKDLNLNFQKLPPVLPRAIPRAPSQACPALRPSFLLRSPLLISPPTARFPPRFPPRCPPRCPPPAPPNLQSHHRSIPRRSSSLLPPENFTGPPIPSPVSTH